MSVYDFLVDFAIASALILVGQFLRAKIKFFQEFFIPASMLAGFIGLLLGERFLNVVHFSSGASSYAGALIIVLLLFKPTSKKRGYDKRAMRHDPAQNIDYDRERNYNADRDRYDRGYRDYERRSYPERRDYDRRDYDYDRGRGYGSDRDYGRDYDDDRRY